MEDEIKNLKLEIQVLTKRISELERIERNRKAFKIIKTLIIIIILIIIVTFGYKLYQQIMDYFNQVKGIIDNPLQSIF